MKKKFEQPGEEKDPPKKGPSFRIIGEISDESKKILASKIKGALHDSHYESMPSKILEELAAKEIPKTREDVKLIAMADEATSELMERSGVTPYGIPRENIHIVPGASYNKIQINDKPERSSARAVSEFQAIFVNAEKIKDRQLFFAALVFHEIMHLKGKMIIEANELGNKLYTGAYKTGFTVFSPRVADMRNKEHSHMSGLEEALVSNEEKKYIKRILELPIFSSEKERMESASVKKIKEDIASREGIPDDDIFWVSEDQKHYLQVSYSKHRDVLGFVVKEIAKEYPAKYKDAGEVEVEFLRAFFGGSFYNISRLVEDVFGKGSFRVLGLMSNDNNSAIGVMEALRSMRRAKASVN